MATYEDFGMTTDGVGSVSYKHHRIHEDSGQFTVLGFQNTLNIQTFATPQKAMAWIDAQEAQAHTILTIDGKPLNHYHVTLNMSVVPHNDIAQLTGTRSACKQLAYYLGLTLHNKARYGEDTYHLNDIYGEDCGQFHDFATPQLVLKKAWLAQQA